MRLPVRTVLPLLLTGLMLLPARAETSGRQSGQSHEGPYTSSPRARAKSSQSKLARLSISDQQFLSQADEFDVGQIKLGELALQKTSNPHIKRFAQKMVNDRQFANQHLQALANDDGIGFPKVMNPQQEVLYKHLQKLRGKQFDQAYMKHAMRALNKFRTIMEVAKTNVRDRSLQAWIDETVPTLQSQENMAKSIDQNLGTKRGSGNAPTAAMR